MSEFHARNEWEEDEEPEPLPIWRRRKWLPIWRRRKWLLIGLGVVVLLALVFTRGKPQHAKETAKGAEPFIGVVVPYQAAKAEAPAASPPTATPAPTPVSAPPTMAAPRYRPSSICSAICWQRWTR